MNLTPSVFKTRLKCARVMRGYSMSELCERIGNAVSKMTISKYESGAMVPGEETLKLLAEALEQPLEFFSRPLSVRINDLKFRKQCRLRVKETNAIQAKVVDHLERYLYIEEVCGNPPSHPHAKRKTVSSANDVIQTAADLRKEWNIGGEGIPNVIALLESRGFRIVEVDAPTTFDGKMRFIRCFKDLSRLTDMKTEGTCFEGLICDDGVAMYWFDVEKDLLTGFHFFPNDELNRVLSGIPLDENLLDASGRLTIAADSELAIALNESLSRRTPSFSTEAPMNERADEAVVAELTTLFRYVYRALHSEFKVAYSKKTQKADGTRYLTFQYFVDPFAEQPHLRTVPNIELSASFMQSLYGATMIEFSQRVIAGCRRRGIETKVNRTDLRRLNAVRMRDEIKANSPFRQLHRKEY